MADVTPKLGRLIRHLGWVRSEGLARLIEEDELNPLLNARLAAARWRWRKTNPVPAGGARPVFIFGVQRSGTNMVARGFRHRPEFEVFNENNRKAFDHFRLRPIETINRLVAESRHRWVVFKPLCDSHRAVELLEATTGGAPARALWIHRQVDSRVRSALAKFGDANLHAMKAIADGDRTLWQAGRLSPESLELIRSFDYDELSPASGAALFWLVRNSLFFELQLDRRLEVRAVSYDRMIESPVEVTRAVCELVGCDWIEAFSAHVEPRQAEPEPPLDIDMRIRAHCDELQTRFDSLPDAARGSVGKSRSSGASAAEPDAAGSEGTGGDHVPSGTSL